MVFHYTRAYVRVFKHPFWSAASPSKMAVPDDFERCNELRRWCLNHSGERPRKASDDQTETSIANWLHGTTSRRTRSISKWPSGRQLTTKETAHLDSILRATVTPIRVGYGATTSQYCVQNSFSVRSKLDMKSSQTVMKQRCRDLGLFVYGDKQALLARIVNEENRLTTDRQVKDNDTDQEMLCTFKGTESLPIMDNMPCQRRQEEITAETKGDFERCSELRQWYKNHSGECPRRNSDDNTEATLATWLDKARSRRARA